ncbi:MAG TPA: 30S ribosomal protein S4 [bacterium]|nr:30S ribosomal protein S4 [bacterium]HOH09322.1 30S ribosomal protein S4 [bacterium]HOY44868.1 30S ribosomal protein S4 [bacterium]HPG83342.1 30S ribosomal protein S4 [bacterium]HPM58855.1 30S ribosomal protein S4 [bacterium]
MARDTGADCKLCRREGMKLFLKGTKCTSDKCPFDKKGYAPGQHGRTRRFKQSEYSLQLREKQKVKRIYGLLESQFHTYFERAERLRGITGENLLRLLETRLDNVVYRLGLAPSRTTARQLVRHRHVLVNGELVDIPSYQLKAGDEIRIREKSRQLEIIHSAMKRVRDGKMVAWLSLDKAGMLGTILEQPARDAIPVDVNEKLIVELYSK